MSSTAIEESGVSDRTASSERLRALFFLPGIDYYRVFESLLRAMLAAGHQVLVALDHQGGGLAHGQARPLDELHERYPGFSYQRLPPRKGLWLIPAGAIRRRLDFLRYLEAESSGAHPTTDAAPRATWGLRALLFLPPFRWPVGRRMLIRFLRRLEAGMPIERAVRSFVSDQAPDVVVVSPLVDFGSAQGDYLRAAEAARIPSVLVVAGEDDLTSKGGIRDAPTLTVAWNEEQVDAAVNLHGLPRERIAAVGAQSSNGLHAPATPGAAEAVERAAATEVVPRRQGRFLRPLLWLLTPLLAVVLPLVRPRATARAVVKAVRRGVGRVRRRAKALKRSRAERRKARAATAKEEKLASAETAKQQKLARAEAKRQAAAGAETAKQQKLARAKTPKDRNEPAAEATNGTDGTQKAR